MTDNQTSVSGFELNEETLHEPYEPCIKKCTCGIVPLLFGLVFVGGGVSWYLLDKFLK